MKYTVMDLFSGAGGLSLGFEQTNKFKVKIAFEKNLSAKETYIKNHKGVSVYEDVCRANYSQILKDHGPIDIIVGGPPCQGFSNANRQNNNLINQNNRLIKEYIRAINEVKPMAFVLENVSMLKSNTHRFYLEREDKDNPKLKEINIKEDLILLLKSDFLRSNYKNLIKNEKSIETHLWKEEHFNLLFSLYRHRKNITKFKSIFNKNNKKLKSLAIELKKFTCEDLTILSQTRSLVRELNILLEKPDNFEDLIKILNSTINTQKMLITVKELYNYNIYIRDFIINKSGLYAVVKSFSVIDYIFCNISNEYVTDSGILSALEFGVPQKRKRFILMGIKKEINKEIKLPAGNISIQDISSVRQAIYDLEKIPTSYNVKEDNGIQKTKEHNFKSNKIFERIKNSNIIYNHIIPQTRSVALQRFKQIEPGKNFHSLDDKYKKNTYSDFSRTQNTIYLRLNYDEPSGTVINVRKSMWIHPNLNRGISVREAARLQTFPDSYRFYGTKDSQYQQVGNAVPPILAKEIATSLYKALKS